MSLTLSALSVRIDQKTVVKSVSLTIKPGECHVLLGPNGSGKTSLAYGLAGHPQYQMSVSRSGQAKLDGLSLIDLPVEERAKAGLFMAFQHPVEVPGVTVWTFLRSAVAANSGRDRVKNLVAFRRELENLAGQVGLPASFLDRGLNEGMSGGEKKRMELLQLMTLAPKYAVLDETDSGLDIDAIKRVAEIISQVKKTHRTGILVITHYQKLARLLKPDKTHIMVAGRIVAEGGLELVDQVESAGYGPWQQHQKGSKS